MKQATKLNQVMLLIKSLSKAEKRYIRLYTNLQNGDKHYMVLYDLACEGFSAEQIYEKFCGKVNEKSFEIAAKHLYRVLLDCLVQLREKQEHTDRTSSIISQRLAFFSNGNFSTMHLQNWKKQRSWPSHTKTIHSSF